jgi:ATP-dependent exoDNAse (exonuclease V) alpha subunit
MRQKDDLRFAEALGRLAKGTMTAEDTDMFNKRCYKAHEELPENAKSAIHLFRTNMEVDAYNIKRVMELTKPGDEKIVFKAKDSVIGQSSPRDAAQALHALASMLAKDTYGLPSQITLQTGVRYMITANVDVSDGLFNGATGVMRFIEKTVAGPVAVWIHFDDENIGREARSNRLNITEKLELKNYWTPLQRVSRIFKTTKKGQAQICREMYPLTIAEGITVHKSQGQSMTLVVVTLSTSMDRNLLYVAIITSNNFEWTIFDWHFHAT